MLQPVAAALVRSKDIGRLLLDDGDERIKTDRPDAGLKRVHLAGEVRRRVAGGETQLVQLVVEREQVRKKIVRAVIFLFDILAEVNAFARQVRKHLLERDDLMLGFVAAVIDEDVQKAEHQIVTLEEM